MNTQLPTHPTCSRNEMINRVGDFRRAGGDAIIALLVVDSTGRIPLCSADRNFSLWLLREIIVTALESEPSQAYGLSCWLVWLTSCPTISNDQTNFFPIAPIIDGNMADIFYATLPGSKPIISLQLKILILQELRILIAGDDLSQLPPNDSLFIPSKLMIVPWLPSSAFDEVDVSRSRETIDAWKYSQNTLACPFRVPISNTLIKDYLIKAKVIETLADILSSDFIKVHSEEWWCILSCFSSLVSGNDKAKGKFDTTVGIEKFIVSFLPLLYGPQSGALLPLLVELCIENGRVISTTRPFVICCGCSDDARLNFPPIKSLLSDNSPNQFSNKYRCSSLAANSFIDCARPKELYVIKAPPKRLVSLNSGAHLDEVKRLRPARANSETEWDTWSTNSRIRPSSSVRSFQDIDMERASSNSRSMLAFFQNQYKPPTPSGVAASFADNISIAEESHTSVELHSYSPFLSTVEWGISNYVELTYQLIQETLLFQADLPSDLLKDKENLKHLEDVDSSKQRLILARRHFTFYMPKGGQLDTRLPWKPQFSKIKIRESNLATLLLSVALILSRATQTTLLSMISNILENPLNAEMMCNMGLPLALTKLMLKLDDHRRQNFGYLLAQLLRHSVNTDSLHELLRLARQINGQDVLDKLNSFFPSRQSLPTIESSTNEVLYVIGRTVERSSPSQFIHFPLCSPFITRIVHPPLDRFPNAKVGFTLSAWMRLGCIGDVPISTFIQLSSTLTSMDLFFRVVYRPSLGRDSDSMVSGLSGLLGESSAYHDESRRSLQLCISFGGTMGKYPKEGNRRWERSIDCLLKQNLDSTGLPTDVETLAALSRFSIPDAIVDFDWTELGDWHFLNISYSIKGISCYVDGKPRRILYWSPNGYNDEDAMDTTKISPYFGLSTKDLPVRICFGGLISEKLIYDSAMQRLTDREKLLRLGQNNVHAEQLVTREMMMMQMFKSRVGSFCGSLGDTALTEGLVTSEWVQHNLQHGPSALDISSLKVLMTLSPQALVSSNSLNTTRHYSFRNVDGIMISSTSSKSKVEEGSSSLREDEEKRSSSSIFTLFSSAVREDDRISLEGNIQVHKTATISDTMESLDGLRMWYPLLLADKARQVTALRVLAHLSSSNAKIYDEIFAIGADKVILYCIHHNPHLSSIESAQVLFEMVLPSKRPNLCSSPHEVIDRVRSLKLLCDIAFACPRRIQLSRSVLDWLKGVCDDVYLIFFVCYDESGVGSRKLRYVLGTRLTHSCSCDAVYLEHRWRRSTLRTIRRRSPGGIRTECC